MLIALQGAEADAATRGYAVITGASSGIGEALARNLAARGQQDLLLIARRRQQLEKLALQLRVEHGSTVNVLACDLSTEEGITECCRATARLDLDLVCLNAGICRPCDSTIQQPAHEMDAMVDLNVRSTTMLLQHFAGTMAASGRGGQVLIVASAAGAAPGVPGVAVYAASKAYLRSLAGGVRAELRQQRCGVSVTCALPSAVDTEFARASGLEHAATFTLPGVRLLGAVQSADAVARSALAAARARRAEVVPGWLPRAYVGLTDGVGMPRALTRWLAAVSFGAAPRPPWSRGAAR